MSKRWKIRKQNAAKREKSREVIDQFYGNVIAELERIKATPQAERDRFVQAFNQP